MHIIAFFEQVRLSILLPITLRSFWPETDQASFVRGCGEKR